MLHRLSWLAALLVTASPVDVTAAPSHPASDARRPPNIILILTDDQGAGDLGSGGNPVVRTPHLDALHADGVRLTDFHVDPTCSPTRAALMSGQHSLRTGVWHTVMGRSLLPPEITTLPERLRSAGYATGIFGKWHLGDNYPFRPQDQGFDRSVIHGGGGVGQTPDHWGNTQFDDTYLADGQPTAFEGYATHIWFDEAQAFIRNNLDRPFFAYIATNAPHSPWRAPGEIVQPYLDAGLPRQVAEFYAMITDLDGQVGELIQMLRAEDLERDTIFIFMTDNGSALMSRDQIFGGDFEAFMAEARTRPDWADWRFNAGLRGFKNDVYEGGHRVPFIIRWPGGGLVGGRDVDTLSAHFDVMPTLLDLADLSVTPDRPLDGRSLEPVLRGEEQMPDRTLVVTNQRVDVPTLERPHVVMTENWRLIVHGERSVVELYDALADPGQQTDLASERPDVVAQLRAELHRWWRDIAPDPSSRQRIVIGGEAESPTRLTAMDWMEADSERDVPWYPGFQPPVEEPPSTAWLGRETEFRPLPWYVRASPGRYRFRSFVHDRPAARPIGRRFAYLEVDGQVTRTEVPGLSAWAEFDLALGGGDHRIRAWFADGDAETTIPAFFLYADRQEAVSSIVTGR